MNRRLGLAALLILLTLVACSRTAGGPYLPYSAKNSDSPHGGGNGGSGSM